MLHNISHGTQCGGAEFLILAHNKKLWNTKIHPSKHNEPNAIMRLLVDETRIWNKVLHKKQKESLL